MDILKTVLDNGLTIQLKEIHNAPIISHWIWYRVGSRDEIIGKTGLSHWCEHMQFKGTPRYPSGVLDKAISREGGFWNAFTYLDWTTYFQTMPAGKADLAFDLEADRMVNSLFDPEEVDSERTVILSELEGNQNDPLFRLNKLVHREAFTVHPYHHEIIGEEEDLRSISRDDLYNFYRRHYAPNNALISVAGDFDSENLLARLRELYEKIPRSSLTKRRLAHEPLLEGEKRVELAGPGETTFVQVAYRTPAANHKDFPVLGVLDSLLTGPASLNMFGGGGISNKTCRLYRSLVEGGLAVAVDGNLQATIDPYLFTITLILNSEQSLDKALQALDGEVRRFQDSFVTTEEIARATKQARALFAYGSESISNQAFWLGHADMFANYDWFVHYVDELEKVTPNDVMRIGQTYMNSANRVVGIFHPEDGVLSSEGGNL
jgi:zinc protease